MAYIKKYILKQTKAVLLMGTALFVFSCTINATEEFGELNRNFPDRTTFNAHVIHKDSGIVRLDLKTPLIEEFTLIDSPYTLMPQGLFVKFWNNNNKKPNTLKADWAKIIDKKKFYEGRGNVKMVNYQGDTLSTNHIFWDNMARQIYTDDTVVIKRADGSINISKNGMRASEDFTRFTFFNNSGRFNADKAGSENPLPPFSTQENNPIDSSTDKKNVPLELIHDKEVP